MAEKKKVVLAYSGGLDTSYCVVYLTEDLGMDVHTVLVDTGGFNEEELAAAGEKALKLGAVRHRTVDAVESLYDECLKYLVFGNVLRNNTYPLSVSAERIIQAKAIASYAAEIGADAIAHGSTGAGNDQVRFDMVFHIMNPGVEIITPIRDNQLSREEEIAYLKKKGVVMDWAKARYSINQGLWGTSVGGRETLTSDRPLPDEAYPSPCTQHDRLEVTLKFRRGELMGVDDTAFNHPVEAIAALQKLASSYAIGRDIHVGDTVIGIKGRVGFEAAAPLVIIKAHHLLEKHVLTKWQQYWKEQLGSWYGMLVHEGQLLEPVMRNIEHFLENTQDHVTGEVYVRFEPYTFSLLGIQSDFDLMSSEFGAYGEMNKGWTGEDVKGFSRILSNQVMIYNQVSKKNAKD